MFILGVVKLTFSNAWHYLKADPHWSRFRCSVSLFQDHSSTFWPSGFYNSAPFRLGRKLPPVLRTHYRPQWQNKCELAILYIIPQSSLNYEDYRRVIEELTAVSLFCKFFYFYFYGCGWVLSPSFPIQVKIGWTGTIIIMTRQWS